MQNLRIMLRYVPRHRTVKYVNMMCCGSIYTPAWIKIKNFFKKAISS